MTKDANKRADNTLAGGIRSMTWPEDGRSLRLLDQRALPGEEVWLTLRDVEAVAEAIESLAVRGAPAIGCAAVLGLAAACVEFSDEPARFDAQTEAALVRLAATRPTAVNLFHALAEVRAALAALPAGASVTAKRAAIRAAAEANVAADADACLRMAEHGAPLLPRSGGVLTHCNTGALATAGIGTALGVIRKAVADGANLHVYADETRPVLQGARLTAWELCRDNIPVTLLTDSMAPFVMKQGRIAAAIVGADRITANGDVANKIGTYGVAVACKHHGIPFYVAAPWSTIDLELPNGDAIVIEERHGDEVRLHGGRLLAPAHVPVYNPAFDVTPAALITAIITERGVFAPGALRG